LEEAQPNSWTKFAMEAAIPHFTMETAILHFSTRTYFTYFIKVSPAPYESPVPVATELTFEVIYK